MISGQWRVPALALRPALLPGAAPYNTSIRTNLSATPVPRGPCNCVSPACGTCSYARHYLRGRRCQRKRMHAHTYYCDSLPTRMAEMPARHHQWTCHHRSLWRPGGESGMMRPRQRERERERVRIYLSNRGTGAAEPAEEHRRHATPLCLATSRWSPRPRRAAGGVACAGRTAPYRHSKTPPLPARAALGCAAGAAALERAILGGCVAAATAFPAGASRGAACCSVLV